ncbi:MAG: ccoP [Deltaproteobacteria bacterium]|nr:ccoP [Deltaproteobacteria bacterium]
MPGEMVRLCSTVAAWPGLCVKQHLTTGNRKPEIMGRESHRAAMAPRTPGRSAGKPNRFRQRLALTLAGAVLAVVGVGSWVGRTAAGEIDGGCLFRTYCAACHGMRGRGDGPYAPIFRPPPSDLRTGFLKRYSTDELVARVRTGGRDDLTLDPEGLRSQATQVEALVAYLKRIPTIDWRLADAGQAVFLCRCADCHGQHGTPGTNLPPGVQRPRDLSDPTGLGARPESELVQLARHGRKGMPALVPRVSEQEGRALAAFLRLFSPGFDLYSRYCANCHCDDGRGRCSLGETVHPPTVVFDQAYVERADPEQLRKNVWHMLAQHQPTLSHYRVRLSAEEARAIISYLEQLP